MNEVASRWINKSAIIRWIRVNEWIDASMNQWINESLIQVQLYIYIYIFPDLRDHHDPSWCWEYMSICMRQLWWTWVADFAAVLAVKPCVLCPFIGWSLGILIISYTVIVPAYPKHSTSNTFLELVYKCQHTLFLFSCFHTCWCIFARFWW